MSKEQQEAVVVTFVCNNPFEIIAPEEGKEKYINGIGTNSS